MKTILLVLIVPLLACRLGLADAPTVLTPPGVLGQAKTVRFMATLYEKGKKEEVSTAYLARPNKAYVQDVDVKTKTVDTVYASDGTTQTEYRKARRHYTKTAAPAKIADMDSRTVALSTLTDFLDRKAFAKFRQMGHYRYVLPLGNQDGYVLAEWLTVDRKTGLPSVISIRRSKANTVHARTGQQVTEVERIVFTHWKLNTPINGAKFSYKPPADALLYMMPKLLTNGSEAPDFTARDKDGKPIHLSDFRGRIVVLDFWATWCGPCQMSLPHTTRLAIRDFDKGVTVLAVNVWDTPKAFQAWLPKHPQYKALTFAIDPGENRDKGIASGLYGVSGIPTQYVIGRDGRIVKSIVGYEPGSTALEGSLKAAGVE